MPWDGKLVFDRDATSGWSRLQRDPRTCVSAYLMPLSSFRAIACHSARV
jgi:hypothetical protein